MQPGTGHRGRQSPEFEVAAQRPQKRRRLVDIESRADAGARLKITRCLLRSLDGVGPAARGRGHRELPPLTRSMRRAQAADLAEDATISVTDLPRLNVHVRLATSYG